LGRRDAVTGRPCPRRILVGHVVEGQRPSVELRLQVGRQHRRLATALLPLFGAEAIVWTVDVAQLDREAALDTLAWTASTLVRAVLDESDGKTSKRRRH
jgi:hypothetical protein